MEQDITQLEKLNNELATQKGYKFEYIKGIAYHKADEPEADTEGVTLHAEWEASLVNLEEGLMECKANISTLTTSIGILEDNLLG